MAGILPAKKPSKASRMIPVIRVETSRQKSARDFPTTVSPGQRPQGILETAATGGGGRPRPTAVAVTGRPRPDGDQARSP